MGSILNRLVNWLLSVVTILVLGILAYLGWYKYLMAGLFLIVGMVMAFLGMQSVRGRVIYSNPFEPPPTSRKRTAYSMITLLAAVFLFTLAILLLAGFIEWGHRSSVRARQKLMDLSDLWYWSLGT
jgi:hypothetical protein